MRRRLRYFWEQLSRDDLFLRCFCFLGGATLASLGGFGLFKTIIDFGDDHWSVLRIVALIFSIALMAWGLLLASRAFVMRGSRLARLAERVFPDGVGEEIIIFFVVVAAPAVFLTVLLRFFGIAGQSDGDSILD